MLLLPERFDQNEWFIILNILFGYLWVFFVPRRFPKAISVLVVLFSVCMALVVDHAIASPPLDLYDIGDHKKYEWMDIITYVMYTPYALLSAYLFDKLNPKGLYVTAYIVGLSLLSVFFEWLADLMHVFTYNKWNLFYSFAVYLVSSSLYLWFFRFIMGHYKKSKRAAMM